MPKFCPNCGAGLVDDQKYCRKCGSSLMTADLTGRRDPRSRQLASQEVGTQAQTVRNLDPNSTGEMSQEDGGTRTMGSIAAPSSVALPGTQRIEGSQRSLDSVPSSTAEFGAPAQAQVQAAPPAAKKSFPIVAVLSIIVIFLVAALGLGYWLYTRSRNGNASSSTDQQTASQPSTNESASTSGSGSTADASGTIPPSTAGTTPGSGTGKTTVANREQTKDKSSSANPTSGSEGGAAKPSEGESSNASKPAETNKNQSTSAAVTPTKTLTADEHIKAGMKAFDSGNYTQALTEYTAATRVQPSNSDVHYLMGLTYEKLKRPADALAEYRKCTSGPYADVSKQHVKRLSK